MLLLGISGKKHSGKTTAAELLRDYLHKTYPNNPVHLLSFAHALKLEVAHACGVNIAYLEANKDTMFRRILQGWGTDFRRAQDTNYWTDKLFKHALSLSDESVVIIHDVRFPNEAEPISRYGELWRIVRPCKDAEKHEELDVHSSETALDNYKFSATMVNDSTKEALAAKLIARFEKAYKDII